jgi:hypothetical protein
MLINWIKYFLSKKIMLKINMLMLNIFQVYKIAALEIVIVQIFLVN